MKDGQQINYQAYLLRLWRDSDEMPWRATLENPHTGEQHHFPGVPQLISFFKQFGFPGAAGTERDL